MEPLQYIIAVGGGFLAGVLNTLAGNGSAITLSILTEVLGLPGNMANGTNRVGVLFQTGASTLGFKNNDKLNIVRSKTIIVSTIIGAIIGGLVAINVSNEQFKFVFKFLMLFMLFVILIKPKRWLQKSQKDFKLSAWIAIPVFLAMGFYGGFIQMGMGIFFLAATVLLAKYDIIEANAVKVMIVFFYTILLIALFQWKGLINWKIGFIIAIGQASGGYLTAHYASNFPRANVWAYRILILVVIAVVIRLFDLTSLFGW